MPEVELWVEWGRSFDHTFNSLLMGISAEAAVREPRICQVVAWCQRIFSATRGDYARLCADGEWQSKNELVKEIGIEGLDHPVTSREIVGQELDWYLPGIYWANLFGPVYLEFFGRERLLSAPWVELRDLGVGVGCLGFTCRDPLAWDAAETRERQEAIKRHLGTNCFFDINDIECPTCAPEFDFSESRNGMPTPTRYQVMAAVRDASGDPEQIIRDVPELAEACRKQARCPAKLDYSAESLAQLDQEIDRARKSANLQDDLSLIRLMAAYYGEVLCRTLGGVWQVEQGNLRRPGTYRAWTTVPTAAVNLGRVGVAYPVVQIMLGWFRNEERPARHYEYLLAGGEVEEEGRTRDLVNRGVLRAAVTPYERALNKLEAAWARGLSA